MTDDMLPEYKKYLMVNVVSKRVKELFRGAKAHVETNAAESTEDVALREYKGQKIQVVPKKPPEKLVDIAQREE